MQTKVTPFLMFEGQAEDAMNFYVSLFKDARVSNIKRYGKGEPGPEGSVMLATFSLNGQDIMCIDSPAKHAFTFTPSISLFVTCGTTQEVDDLFAKLSPGGQVMMPLDKYPFSERFAWVADRYGVSWQLMLKPA